jgi:hypothetical protein
MGSLSEKNILLIPYWIINNVQRSQLPLTAILDLKTLTGITCAQDLAMISLLNERSEKVFGISNYSPTLTINWYKDDESWNKFNTQIKPLESIVGNELDSRLFNESSREDRYDKPFEIKDIDPKTFLVIVYPGYFGGAQAKQCQLALSKELLKLFFVYEGYDNMARRQVFEHYLNNL